MCTMFDSVVKCKVMDDHIFKCSFSVVWNIKNSSGFKIIDTFKPFLLLIDIPSFTKLIS